jgi:hypothetical protein
MSDGASTFNLLEGGISAEHPTRETHPVLVAPTTANDVNVIKASLEPIACLKLEDTRFSFDSSFVVPKTRAEFQALSRLLDSLKAKFSGPPLLSIFGHTDPTGNDDYNKALSGRRAAAIYATLTRKTEIWEDLFSNKGKFTQTAAGDKWGDEAIQTMRTALNLTDEGKPTEAQRQSLYLQYMDFLCVNDKGKLFQLDPKKDFLAQGKGKDLKGDMQGCSEFNPLLLVSKAEKAELDQKDKKADRDKKNQKNRRVMILLFKARTETEPSKWPCPTVKEGVAGCKARFFSDGEKRRQNTEEEREFDKTKNTFACRFYQRMLEVSPCERSVKTFEIRLYSPIGRAIPFAPCEITLSNRKPFPSTADTRGIITMRDVEVPATCKIRWGFPPKEGSEPELIFNLDLFLEADEPLESDRAEEGKRKLNNLGYNRPELAENVRSFQRDYGHLTSPPLDITGDIDDRTMKVLREVYEQSADDLRNTPVTPVS